MNTSWIKNLTLASTLLSTLASANTGNYMRVWQGFQRDDLSKDQFLQAIPSFMGSTVKTYQDGALNQYLVVIPPKDKPAYLPDEFALVVLSSEATYKAVRATPEGQAYGDSHWKIFKKDVSKSAPLSAGPVEIPATLVSNTAYDLIAKAIDWSSGANFIYVGTRKEGVSKEEYLQRLSHHVQLAAKNLGPQGLQGYVVLANENFEVAYLNYTSVEAKDKALSSVGGTAVMNDAGEFMDTLMFNESQSFDLQSAHENSFYQTVRPQN